MSTLLVEVCEVSAVEKHPFADRLGIATVKGWKTVVGFDPATGRYDFAMGERCIYFPPDSVLPPALANSPYKVCKSKACKAQRQRRRRQNGGSSVRHDKLRSDRIKFLTNFDISTVTRDFGELSRAASRP
jgi:hypothetical protein